MRLLACVCSTSNDECPASITAALMTASRARAGLLETRASAADGSRPHSPHPQEGVIFVGTGTGAGAPEADEGLSSEDMDVLPSLPRDRRESLSYDGAPSSKMLWSTPLLGVQDQKALPSSFSQPATQLTSTQVLETFARAGMLPAAATAAAAAAAAAAHHLEGRLEQHSVVGCVPVNT
eukprot:1156368-Pelagomonas_calceolata.AAC.4